MADLMQQIKELRESTGAGVMDSKRALEAANGDMEAARKALVEKGLASAEKRAGRAASEGTIGAYIHAGGKAGAMVELRCETDFVARTDEFQELARQLAMQVVAMSPAVVSRKAAEEAGDAAEGLSADEVLEEQEFIKDASLSVAEAVKNLSGKVGENIYINGFRRIALSG